MTPNQTITAFPEFADGGTKTKPGDAKYSAGFVEADVLPAEWLNWLLNKPSAAITEIKSGLESIEKELNNLLTAGGETADITDDAQVVDSVRYLRDSITGVLANLATTDKSTLVAAINEIKNSLGTAAGKTAGSASGNVPLNGAALGTTNNNIVVTDSNGKLKTYGVAGSASGKNYTDSLSFTSSDLIQSNTVAYSLCINVNTETKQGNASTLHTFTAPSEYGSIVEQGKILRMYFTKDCYTNSTSAPTNSTYYPRIKIGDTSYLIYRDPETILTPHKMNSKYYWWSENTLIDFYFINDKLVILGNPLLIKDDNIDYLVKVYADGYVEQWHNYAVPQSSDTQVDYTWTFPVAFTSIRNVQTTRQTTQNNSNNTYCWCKTSSNTSVKVCYRQNDAGYVYIYVAGY